MCKLFLPAILMATASLSFLPSEAQLINKVKEKVRQATENAPQRNPQQQPEENTNQDDTNTNTTTTEDNQAPASNNLAYTSKYDFVPGEKVIAFEDFNAEAVGDFPTRWNTNASAEVVTLNNKEGKWLKMNKQGVFHPEFIKAFPENFTLEFDLGVPNNYSFHSSNFIMNLGQLGADDNFADFGFYINWKGLPAMQMTLHPSSGDAYLNGHSSIIAGKDGNHTINNHVDTKQWNNTNKSFAHVSLWRQNQRLRVYVNGEKIWDLPRAFDPAGKYNTLTFAFDDFRENDYYVLGNIRLAIGAPDTRNKLITEGKFVTSGILFDVNSDKVKPESYGVIKEIGTVLKENAAVKVKIVGHTDSDGDDAKNLDLSKRRAAAVKNMLTSEFGIDASRMTTDGLGETKPVADNGKPEGKAQNRRVEFIKM